MLEGWKKKYITTSTTARTGSQPPPPWDRPGTTKAHRAVPAMQSMKQRFTDRIRSEMTPQVG